MIFILPCLLVLGLAMTLAVVLDHEAAFICTALPFAIGSFLVATVYGVI